MEGVSIYVQDNFLSKEEQNLVLNYCLQSSYFPGITDGLDTPPTGLCSPIYEKNSLFNSSSIKPIEDGLNLTEIFDLFQSKIIEQFSSSIENMKLNEMYVNIFAPKEIPYFHTDIDETREGKTFLYYVNQEWDMNDGGETQFLINNELHGVLPIPNRMVVFDAKILHRATSFRDRFRFTLATRYST